MRQRSAGDDRGRPFPSTPYIGRLTRYRARLSGSSNAERGAASGRVSPDSIAVRAQEAPHVVIAFRIVKHIAATRCEHCLVRCDRPRRRGSSHPSFLSARRGSERRRGRRAGSSNGVHRIGRRKYLLHKGGDVLHSGGELEIGCFDIQGFPGNR